MIQRGRPKSLALVAPQRITDRIERLKPPRQLTEAEAEVWRVIVHGQPADWFGAGAIPVLAQLCRHVVLSNRVAELINNTEDQAQWLPLLKEQRAESDAINRLTRSLRLTPITLHHEEKKNRITAVNQPWAFSDAG